MVVSKKVSGTIVGYARGPNTQYPQIVLVKLDIPDNEKIDNYIGRKIIVFDKYGNRYVGKILRKHSRKHHVVRARFKPNIPGQLIGATVIVE